MLAYTHETFSCTLPPQVFLPWVLAYMVTYFFQVRARILWMCTAVTLVHASYGRAWLCDKTARA